MVTRIRELLTESRLSFRSEGRRKLRPVDVEVLLHVAQDLTLEEHDQGGAGDGDRRDDRHDGNRQQPHPDGVAVHGEGVSMM